MNCPACGATLAAPDAHYCIICGRPVTSVPAPVPGSTRDPTRDAGRPSSALATVLGDHDGAPPPPWVPVTSPGVGTVHLPSPGGSITLGRGGDGVDVVLDHPQVSRLHARLERRGDGTVVLRDLHATNGTLVDGKRVRDAVALREGAVVQIGPFKLVYDGSTLAAYDQRGAMRLDALGIGRTVTVNGRVRTLLHETWLTVEPREMVALVGGSGAGKSTLLGALAGYSRATAGRLLVNGDDYYAGFDAWRASVGYVPQDDILHRTLPAGRALAYAARLRLPPDTSRAEITRRVDGALASVEMTNHRGTRVEDLSGGQRKRVSIAAELLADPSLFFLDEPTSGLDPGLEKRLMHTLRAIADGGRTVVLVTHAAASLALCDLVAVMADGRVVYFGPPAQAPGFFGVPGGDFADVYNRLDTAPSVDFTAEREAWHMAHPEDPGEPTPSALWAQRYRASALHRRYVAARQGALGEPQSLPPPVVRPSPPNVSPFRQWALLLVRNLDLVGADRRNVGLLLLQAPVVAGLLLLAAPAHALAGEGSNSTDALRVLLMTAAAATWFGVINAAKEIAREAPIYRRERLATLRVGPYVLARFAALTAVTLIQSAALVGVLSVGTALPRNGLLLLCAPELLVTTLLAALAAQALGLLISALASTPDKATSAVPFALIPQVLFAGTIFPLSGASTVLSWFTGTRWAVAAYGVTVNVNALPMGPGLPSALAAGVADSAYTPDVTHLVTCWGVLAAQAALCLALTAAALRARDPR